MQLGRSSATPGSCWPDGQRVYGSEVLTPRGTAIEAKRRGLSLSRYISLLVTNHVPRAWPAGYLDEVVGSCAGIGLEEPADLPVDDVSL